MLFIQEPVTINMKTNISITFIFWIGMLIPCHSQTVKKEITDTIHDPYWTLEKAKKLASDFNSPKKWDMKTLEMEIENLDKYPSSDYPLNVSPFPTPEYASPGNGNGAIETIISEKKIIGHYVIIGKGEHSDYLFGNPEDEYVTYFTILTISDEMESENPVMASSRNHPHYVSQGSLNTSSKSRVDWIATQFADKNAFAMVNSRLFDLRVGRLILVAPQKDGSIRFYQTDMQTLNSKEREKYIEELKTSKTAIEFFNDKNNI